MRKQRPGQPRAQRGRESGELTDLYTEKSHRKRSEMPTSLCRGDREDSAMGMSSEAGLQMWVHVYSRVCLGYLLPLSAECPGVSICAIVNCTLIIHYTLKLPSVIFCQHNVLLHVSKILTVLRMTVALTFHRPWLTIPEQLPLLSPANLSCLSSCFSAAVIVNSSVSP